MSDQRFLLLGGVGLVKGRIREANRALVAVCDELDPVLKTSGFRKEAPFNRLDGIIRFGENNNYDPELERIKDNGLPFAIEVEMTPLRAADFETVKNAFRLATISALITIGKKYQLPIEQLESLLDKNDEELS